MNNLDFKDLILKQFAGTLTKEEIVKLQKLLKEPHNQKELELILRDYHDLTLTISKNNKDKAYNTILKKIDQKENKQKSIKKILPFWFKYAAILILFVGLTWFFKDTLFNQDSGLHPLNEAITLELENGEIKTFDISKSQEILNVQGKILGIQNANSLEYVTNKSENQLSYNTLRIPRGKKFKLKLSDGTLIQLNSESTLKYPVSFMDSEKREVYLSGEAFFNVSHDENKPFILHTDKVNIEVLGTSFNVDSYNNDNLTEVVLVEGSVALSQKGNEENKVKLKPNQKGSFHQDDKKISLENVKTYFYTSWLEGKLVFRNEKFNSIIKTLQRSFNIEINNSNEELGNEVFNATFDNKSIDEILSYFKEIHHVNYNIENNSIFIY
jgi:hypothetical protein